MSWLSKTEYSYIYTKVPRICVDFVILTPDNKIYLEKRQEEPYNGFYSLPGGRIQFRETISDAMQRIALRELNCKVVEATMLGAIEFLDEYQNNEERHSISIVYLVKLDEEKKYVYSKKHKLHPTHLNFLKQHELW